MALRTSGTVVVGGAPAWVHAAGECGCVYHTFDALEVGGEGPRKVHVLLPADYSGSGKGWPVLYMNDGRDVMFDGEAGEGSQSLRMHSAVHTGTDGLWYGDDSEERASGGVIVVAVGPLDRDREYTHVRLPGGGGGGAAVYCAWLCGGLVPFVDENYRTVATAGGRAIGGCSHGGLAAFLAACWRPDVFGAALCLSPSLWLGMDSVADGEPLELRSADTEPLAFCHLRDGGLYRECQATFALPSRVTAERGTLWPCQRTDDEEEITVTYRPRLYLDWGLLRVGGMHNMLTEAMVTKRGRELVELLQEHGYVSSNGSREDEHPSELMAVEDALGGHDTLAWRHRLPSALRWLIAGAKDAQ